MRCSSTSFRGYVELCAEHGCRFQAIDLRWGISEGAFRHQPLRMCLDEIARCQRVTPRPNFIILLGERYGARPAPYEIPADEFQQIEQHVTDPDDRALLQDWYQRNDNAVPAVYDIRPRTGKFADLARWEVVERRLRAILLQGIGCFRHRLLLRPPHLLLKKALS
jgi:hypothetical protein